MSDEVRKFEAETQKVLDLMVHSLYSNKDIFLRELVANAADAIDKARFLSLTDTKLAADWEIRIEADKKNNQLRIVDNGVGMTHDEIVEHIGTIAKSGTKAFVKALEEKKVLNAPELIGQFGVGFYSCFMVADKVTIETKRAGLDAPAVHWESKGDGEYSLSASAKQSQGTEITLDLKPDAHAYLEQWQIQSIIRKYSDYIEYPVRMENEAFKAEEPDSEKLLTLNSMKAIWVRAPKDVSDEDHKQFFSHISHAPGDPLKHIHIAAEGASEFKALLYIPEKSPYSMFFPENRKKNLHLYIRRVFITDECQGLLPEYLRFVSGVVDSSDLPLNVSRETLQDNPGILKISKNIVRKIFAELEKLRDTEREKFDAFFKEFGRHVKEGVHTDYANRDKLQDLLLYETLNNPAGKLVTLKEYVAAMPAGQPEIYFLVGENRRALENSPLLEAFRAKGYDVLLMTDPIDEFVVQGLVKYDDKHLKPIGKGELDIDADKKKENEGAKKDFAALLEALQKALDADVKEARLSTRLTDSACCLVGDAYDTSPFLERIYKSMNQDMPKSKRILELNPSHPLVKALKELHGKDPADPRLADYAAMLYDQALLTEGTALPDPLKFAKRVADLMASSLKA